MIALKSVPYNGWDKEYVELMKDPYVRKKYNRERRIQDKQAYIKKYLPEINSSMRVLDLGPGPGEFLEVCRKMGCEIHGIDAPIGQSEMGDEYIRLCKLMSDRQKLNIKYIGVDKMLEANGKFPYSDCFFDVINSQGSIEQIFKNRMDGVPCRVHKNCNLLSWIIDTRTKELFLLFFEEINRILKHDGICFIYANGAKNVSAYNDMVFESVKKVNGLYVINSLDNRIHKIGKTK